MLLVGIFLLLLVNVFIEGCFKKDTTFHKKPIPTQIIMKFITLPEDICGFKAGDTLMPMTFADTLYLEKYNGDTTAQALIITKN